MRVKVTLFALAIASTMVGVFAQSAAPSGFTGRWNLRGTGADMDKVYWLEVYEKDGQLKGSFLNRSAHATPLYSVKVENNELVFQLGAGEGTLEDPVRMCGLIFRAKLEGGKLMGHHTLPAPPCAPNPNRGRGAGGAAAAGGGGREGAAPGAGREGGGARAAAPPAAPATPPAPTTINWVGTRQPVWPYSNANGAHTYGKPVVVVGAGVGQEAWTGFSEGNWQTKNCANRWTYENGTMKNAVGTGGEPPTCNIYTKEKFKDFKAEAELLLDQGQNSGFYLRGRYELQLQVNATAAAGPTGATAGRQTLGAIYGWKAADFYAGKPAGEWQTLEAIVVGNRVTAYINGVRIHDNAELPAFTGGALDNDELAPGPLMIQGDHSRVTFRKLVITPITKAGM